MTQMQIAGIVQKTLNGDAEAFRAIVQEYRERLFAFVWRIVRDHHEAEDLTQASFVKAYESLASYSDKFAFSTWLYTIAYRLSLNGLRRKKALSGDVNFENVGAVTEDASEALANSESARKLKGEIWAAVDQLTPPQRTAVMLFYQEGQSCQEIAHVLGIPAVTVKSHLHRAREKLRDLLDPRVASEWPLIKFPAAQSA